MPTLAPIDDVWRFPWWLALLLGSVPASIVLGALILGLYFKVGWRRSYNELAWRVRVWFIRPASTKPGGRAGRVLADRSPPSPDAGGIRRRGE